MSEAVKATYEPALNGEHTEYKWFDADDLHALTLHPVVRLLFASTGELPLAEFRELTATAAS